MPREDILMYRIVILIVLGLGGFTGLRYFSSEAHINTKFMEVLPWICIPILALAVIIPFAVRYYFKIDEKNNVITSVGISLFAAMFSIMGICYYHTSSPSTKFQVMFLVVVFLAFLYNIHAREFYRFSFLFATYMFFMYYANVDGQYVVDRVLSYSSKFLIFALPAFMIAFEIIARLVGKRGKIRIGKLKIRYMNDNFYAVSVMALSVLAAAARLIVIFSAVTLTPVMIALAVIYFAFGIVCTIKLF